MERVTPAGQKVPDVGYSRPALRNFLPKFNNFLLQLGMYFLHLRVHFVHNVCEVSVCFGRGWSRYSPTILRFFPFVFEVSGAFGASVAFFAVFSASCPASWAAFSATSSALRLRAHWAFGWHLSFWDVQVLHVRPVDEFGTQSWVLLWQGPHPL